MEKSLFRAPNLCLKPHRPVQLAASQVTALAATPDNRLIAVAMLNFHVDIYYTDTFKVLFFVPSIILSLVSIVTLLC